MEVRLLIWEFALLGPRIVFLEATPAESFVCTRVYTDRKVIPSGDGSTLFSKAILSDILYTTRSTMRQAGIALTFTLNHFYHCYMCVESLVKLYRRLIRKPSFQIHPIQAYDSTSSLTRCTSMTAGWA
jgi:hypothetical protein